MLNLFLNLTRPIPSLVLAIASAMLWRYFDMPGLATAEPGVIATVSAMSVLSQIAATMLGFMMAVLAILASITNAKLIRNMQRTGHFHNMLMRIFTCSLGFAGLTVAALVISFRPDMLTLLAPCVFGFSVLSTSLFVSSITMLWQTLAHLKPSSPKVE